MLSEQADGRLCHHQRVGRIDPELGERRRVRFLPRVPDLELDGGDDRHLHHVERRGVDHHRRVDAVERAALEQLDLPAAALLRRRAQDRHGEAGVVRHRQQRHARAGRHGGDDVVAARLADLRQRVVLAADGDV